MAESSAKVTSAAEGLLVASTSTAGEVEVGVLVTELLATATNDWSLARQTVPSALRRRILPLLERFFSCLTMLSASRAARCRC